MEPEAFNLCSLEPIHVPGRIQGHGVLVVIDLDGTVCFCSENTDTLFGIPARELVGKPFTILNRVLGKKDDSAFLQHLIELAHQEEQFQPLNPYIVKISGNSWNMILSKSSSYYLLDFEPQYSDLSFDMESHVGSGLSEMLADKALQKVLENSATQIKNIIGYDRVMIYKFHTDGHGEVVAEEKNTDMESWLGLHYPASDIPQQARALYKQNWTRLIADVHEEDIPIIGLRDELIDLTYSTLRAVSSVHIQYLKNMGVASSFSISILVDGELWGLIACHNYTQRFINFRQREAAKLIGQVLSSCITLRRQELYNTDRQRLQQVVGKITRELFESKPIPCAIKANAQELMETFSASGLAFKYEGELHTFGDTPDTQILNRFCQMVAATPSTNIIASTKISSDFQDIPLAHGKHAGLLANCLNESLKDCLLLFRQEKLFHIRWAGNPEKIVRRDANGLPFISPRNSFALWTEQVRYTSEEWSVAEKDALLQLRHEINLAISRRANELRLMNEKLRKAYAELDSFAHTISHDLKTPLTAIKGFADIISRNAQVPQQAQMMADRIKSSSEKMHSMIETVLDYSRIGQKRIQQETINMHNLIHDICGQVMIGKPNEHLTLEVLETPDIKGDPIMIFQVFLNVIENAVKYSHKVAFPKIVIDGVSDETTTTYKITDNGIGIKAREQHSIFDLFSRAGDPSMFKGSGVGLSIVKKIMTRHGAEIAVNSEEGVGTTFMLRFPHVPKMA
ncbi:GAF domain-containing protein [Olivibacter sp. SDN3]|uniref:ATP-binding protein n=1 Tax=Olivibacter sp. SDN3 TaxID=2764720 RepID=UPI0016517BA7|nr:ATP-binding protein [Olivibacter sp. SDN3]QNL47937.1 GAF domain-containing protein [Olivibacter sp. SDN3]